MEIYSYILKSSALLSLFFLIYEFFLKRETFFNLNRFFLISGIVIAMGLPFLTFTNTIIVEESLSAVYGLGEESSVGHSFPIQSDLGEINSFWGKIDYKRVFVYLYLLGATFFLIKFFISLMKLHFILRYRPKSHLANGVRYIETNRKTNPFSFFKTVVYNPSLHTAEELEMILHHENVHTQNYHSLDIFLGQLIIALHWFNPFVWLYGKRMDQNLEFIADYKTTAERFPKKSYQMSLLQTAISTHLPLPVNNFHSFTKIRILMLNKDKSHQIKRFKVFLVLPLLMVFLMGFQIKTVLEVQTPPSSQLENGFILNTEMEQPSKIFSNNKEDAVLIFNEEGVPVNEAVPSLNKSMEMHSDSTGITLLQLRNGGEEDLKTRLEKTHAGAVLQFFEGSDVASSKDNAENKRANLLSFPSGNKNISKSDGTNKEAINHFVNKPRILITHTNSIGDIEINSLQIEPIKTKDFLRNKFPEVKVDVRFQVKKKNEASGTEVKEDQEMNIDLLKELKSAQAFDLKRAFQEEGKLKEEKSVDPNEIKSFQVFKQIDYKYSVATDKNDKVVVVRVEFDQTTLETSLNK